MVCNTVFYESPLSSKCSWNLSTISEREVLFVVKNNRYNSLLIAEKKVDERFLVSFAGSWTWRTKMPKTRLRHRRDSVKYGSSTGDKDSSVSGLKNYGSQTQQEMQGYWLLLLLVAFVFLCFCFTCVGVLDIGHPPSLNYWTVLFYVYICAYKHVQCIFLNSPWYLRERKEWSTATKRVFLNGFDGWMQWNVPQFIPRVYKPDQPGQLYNSFSIQSLNLQIT